MQSGITEINFCQFGQKFGEFAHEFTPLIVFYIILYYTKEDTFACSMLTDEQPPAIVACESALSAWVQDPIHRAQHSERALAFLDDPSTIRRYVRIMFGRCFTAIFSHLFHTRLLSPPPQFNSLLHAMVT